MQEVKLHTVGRIEYGEKYQGWYVFIQTYQNAGAYLILIANNEMFGRNENGEVVAASIGYDDWVPDKESLTAYFDQYNWQVSWLDEKKAVWLSNLAE